MDEETRHELNMLIGIYGSENTFMSSLIQYVTSKNKEYIC